MERRRLARRSLSTWSETRFLGAASGQLSSMLRDALGSTSGLYRLDAASTDNNRSWHAPFGSSAPWRARCHMASRYLSRRCPCLAMVRDQGRQMDWDQGHMGFSSPQVLCSSQLITSLQHRDLIFRGLPGRRHDFDPISILSASLPAEVGPPALCELNLSVTIRSGLHQSLSLPSHPPSSHHPQNRTGETREAESGTREAYSSV